MQYKRIIPLICIAFLIINIIAPVIYLIYNNGAIVRIVSDNPAGFTLFLPLNTCEKPGDAIISSDSSKVFLVPADQSIQMFIDSTYLIGTACTLIYEAGLSIIEKPPKYSA